MKKIYILLSFLGLLVSCDDYLNVPNTEKIIREEALGSTRNIEAALIGAYGVFADNNALSNNWRVFGDILADHVALNSATGETQSLYNRQMSNAVFSNNWQFGYYAIQRANNVIGATETEISDDEYTTNRDRMRGEAYFIRAVCHFEMVRYYGHQYGYNSGEPQSGIVIRSATANNIDPIERATVEEVYALVIEDLKMAESLLPENYDPALHLASYNGRATKDAASAYLAKVYFQQNDYVNAMSQINKVIGNEPGNLSKYKLEGKLADVFSKTGTAKASEVIFQLISVTSGGVINSFNGGLVTKYKKSEKNPFTQFVASNRFLTDAAYESKDKRKTELLDTATKGKVYTKKYDAENMNIPIIRSAELLLDRAEINALNGNFADALRDVNVLRSRAGVSQYNSSNPPQNTLELVRKERIRELAFEGDRLHDLRRRKETISPGDRSGGSIDWNSNGLLFKIPSNETTNNALIVQNPD